MPQDLAQSAAANTSTPQHVTLGDIQGRKASVHTPCSTVGLQPTLSQYGVVLCKAIGVEVQYHDTIANGRGPVPAAVLCIDDRHVV